MNKKDRKTKKAVIRDLKPKREVKAGAKMMTKSATMSHLSQMTGLSKSGS